MEKIVRRMLLFDFYGELLTENQKRIYLYVARDDQSLSEIAKELGISRQAVHDSVVRSDRQLIEFEERLGLIARFDEARGKFGEIRELVEAIKSDSGCTKEIEKLSDRILTISDEILEEL